MNEWVNKEIPFDRADINNSEFRTRSSTFSTYQNEPSLITVPMLIIRTPSCDVKDNKSFKLAPLYVEKSDQEDIDRNFRTISGIKEKHIYFRSDQVMKRNRMSSPEVNQIIYEDKGVVNSNKANVYVKKKLINPSNNGSVPQFKKHNTFNSYSYSSLNTITENNAQQGSLSSNINVMGNLHNGKNKRHLSITQGNENSIVSNQGEILFHQNSSITFRKAIGNDPKKEMLIKANIAKAALEISNRNNEDKIQELGGVITQCDKLFKQHIENLIKIQDNYAKLMHYHFSHQLKSSIYQSSKDSIIMSELIKKTLKLKHKKGRHMKLLESFENGGDNKIFNTNKIKTIIANISHTSNIKSMDFQKQEYQHQSQQNQSNIASLPTTDIIPKMIISGNNNDINYSKDNNKAIFKKNFINYSFNINKSPKHNKKFSLKLPYKTQGLPQHNTNTFNETTPTTERTTHSKTNTCTETNNNKSQAKDQIVSEEEIFTKRFKNHKYLHKSIIQEGKSSITSNNHKYHKCSPPGTFNTENNSRNNIKTESKYSSLSISNAQQISYIKDESLSLHYNYSNHIIDLHNKSHSNNIYSIPSNDNKTSNFATYSNGIYAPSYNHVNTKSILSTSNQLQLVKQQHNDPISNSCSSLLKRNDKHNYNTFNIKSDNKAIGFLTTPTTPSSIINHGMTRNLKLGAYNHDTYTSHYFNNGMMNQKKEHNTITTTSKTTNGKANGKENNDDENHNKYYMHSSFMSNLSQDIPTKSPVIFTKNNKRNYDNKKTIAKQEIYQKAFEKADFNAFHNKREYRSTNGSLTESFFNNFLNN